MGRASPDPSLRRRPARTAWTGFAPKQKVVTTDFNVANRRVVFSNGSRRMLFLGFDALEMPVFSARSFGA